MTKTLPKIYPKNDQKMLIKIRIFGIIPLESFIVIEVPYFSKKNQSVSL